jgi:hypothetical protein
VGAHDDFNLRVDRAGDLDHAAQETFYKPPASPLSSGYVEQRAGILVGDD